MNKDNNNDITLVILAAGMGSRFGGLKQIEPVGPNNEFIIDYSVYDAKLAGFNKIVFIIKEENFEDFKNTIGKRVEEQIEVSYVFQKNDNLPSIINLPDDRIKPLGTAHAILCCKDVVKTPFAIINADDFYGRDAYIKAADFLRENSDNTGNSYGMIGYNVVNTLAESGAVKRGICSISNDYLLELIESSVEKKDGKIIATPLEDKLHPFPVDENTTVSMNMLLFNPSLFDYLENDFPDYLERNKENLSSCEYLIPIVLFEMIKNGCAKVKVINTSATWYGITYKEDLVDVKNAIKKLISVGDYKKDLWEE